MAEPEHTDENSGGETRESSSNHMEHLLKDATEKKSPICEDKSAHDRLEAADSSWLSQLHRLLLLSLPQHRYLLVRRKAKAETKVKRGSL